MPEYKNKYPGISPQKNGYRARLEHEGKHFEKTFRTLAEASRWRGELKSDLKRCPKSVSYVRGQWECEVVHKHVRKQERFLSLDEALEWLQIVKAQIRAGVFEKEVDNEITLDSFSENFFQSRAKVTTKSTMLRYRSTYENHLSGSLGHYKVVQINRLLVKDWIASKKTTGVSNDATRKALGLLKDMLTEAEDADLIPANPIMNIKPPSVSRSAPIALSEKELVELASRCGPYEGMILFAGIYGARDGELRSLRVSDVDSVNMELVIDSSFTKVKSGTEIEGPTKTKTTRVLPLTEYSLSLLQPYLNGKKEDDFLFRGKTGGKLNYGWFRKTFLVPAAKAMGIGKIGMHTLRHTAATLHSRNSRDDVSLARILGHAQVSTTKNHYVQKSRDDLVGALKSVESNLG